MNRIRNRLRNTKIYLAGSMDRVLDGGVQWRQRMIRDMADLGINFLDPCNKPTQTGKEDEETRARRHAAKAAGDFAYVANEMKPIRHVDRRMVHISDALIVYLDKANSGFGTISELTLAISELKPCLIMQEGGIQNAPDWLFAQCRLETIFGRWEDLYAYMHHIDDDEVIDDLGRWVWFDWHGSQT